MQAINIHDAKTRFSRLIEAVIRGEDVIIAKAGKPVAKLIPYEVKKVKKFGALRGKIKISEDFDKPLSDDVMKTFEDNL